MITSRHAGVRFEQAEAVLVVTLNREAHLNAADQQLHTALATIWQDIGEDDTIRAVVLTGAGKAFSAGGDLTLLSRMVEDTELRKAVLTEAAAILTSMLELPQPLVAAVNGPAVGLGCSLASLCDLVVADESAYFSDPHVQLGLVASDGGAITWPLHAGLQRTKEFILLGGRLTAADAHAIGIVNRVVADGTSLEVALEFAHLLAKQPLQATQASKRLLNVPLKQQVEASIEMALRDEFESFDTPELQANVAKLISRSARD